jgi:hypothetical protein
VQLALRVSLSPKTVAWLFVGGREDREIRNDDEKSEIWLWNGWIGVLLVEIYQ